LVSSACVATTADNGWRVADHCFPVHNLEKYGRIDIHFKSLNFKSMKRFKIGFLAIVALLAIGLTAATKADIMKKALVERCEDFDLIAIELPDAEVYYNSDFTVPTGTQTSCPAEDCAKLVLENPDEDFDCDNSGSFFCCAKVIDDDCDNPEYPLSVDIICKTTE
jgi:hypothetical protein